MPRFFTKDIDENFARITGQDAKHISRVLRMKPGEKLTVCDGMGNDYLCEITSMLEHEVTLSILDKSKSKSEPAVSVTLFQGLPKSDKMDYIVQKSVELGITRVVPVVTARSVSRPDEKSMHGKIERWNKIAAEAAKQCGRGQIPKVETTVTFHRALDELRRMETALLFYEGSTAKIAGQLNNTVREIGFLIGPEGGLEPGEVQAAKEAGIFVAGLGPRILRTETAPICVLSIIMYATGNL
ncbi:MAG TPA: 16S rRNA (uracil(1498)-N(3))-methyltransferase [Clostridia bacterium]|nr:16S rRNA (uracil(1498)-N(3))-methyltransferase [Clostridia bacterium]